MSRRVLIYGASIWQWKSEDSSSSNFYYGEAHPSSWLIIENGRISEISLSSSATLPEMNTNDVVINAQGNLLIPGLSDAHIHVEMTGESQYFVDLSTCNSIAELKSSLQSHINNHSDLPWIQGVNWDQSKLGRYPTRFDLDEVCSDKPIFLWRACWHIGVANTSAMLKAGIGLDCSGIHIEGGAIDTENGSPTGIFRERAVELMTMKAMGNKSQSDLCRFIKEGLALCVQSGLTSVQTNDEGSFKVYQGLRDVDELPLRVFLTPTFADLNKSVDKGGIQHVKPIRSSALSSELPPHYSSDPLNTPESMLVMERVKIFSDGSLGAETAALRLEIPKEFSNETIKPVKTGDNMSGILMYKREELVSMISTARNEGYRVEIHAIGDAAAEQVLNAIVECGLMKEERPILTHCQILGADLIETMQAHNVIANVQPSFVPTDMRWVENRGLLKEQHDYAYAWKTLLQSNIHVAGGSDAPIESFSPFLGMFDAMFRQGRGADCDVVFRQAECLTFAEALYIYTKGGAYAAKCEHVLGSIEVGFAADLVLVNNEILHDPRLLQTLKPDLVLVGGRIAHASLEFTGVIDNGSTLGLKEARSTSVTLGGPFIPGKAGGRSMKQPGFTCCCLLLGRECSVQLKKEN